MYGGLDYYNGWDKWAGCDIYLDFNAALDKVPHKQLMKKVWAVGLTGKIYNWIKDFLNNRSPKSYSKW